jgi:hypothetical protein
MALAHHTHYESTSAVVAYTHTNKQTKRQLSFDIVLFFLYLLGGLANRFEFRVESESVGDCDGRIAALAILVIVE